jgi:signal transduction histidine kinase
VTGTKTRGETSDDAADACRQVAELLGFQSVDTVSGSSAPVEDVLDGKVDGLIVFRVGDDGSPIAPRRGSGQDTSGSAARSDSPVRPLRAAVEAVRDALQDEATGLPQLLARAGRALGAGELTLVRQRGERLEMVMAGAEGPVPAPAGVHAQLARARSDEPLADDVVEALARALGLGPGRVTVVRCGSGSRLEILAAGWEASPTLPRPALEALAATVALAADVLDSRDDAVRRQLHAERMRWAGEIHDGLTQVVTGAYLELKTLRGRIARDPAGALASLDDVMHDLRGSIAQVRALLFDLADESDEREADAIEDYVAGVAARWQLPVRAAVDEGGEIDPALRPALNMVIREAIANAAKHADAAKVEVRLRRERNELVLEVEDDGRGFDPSASFDLPGHFGLRLLRERVARAGGSVAIRSTPGKGTVVVARLTARAGPEGALE